MKFKKLPELVERPFAARFFYEPPKIEIPDAVYVDVDEEGIEHSSLASEQFKGLSFDMFRLNVQLEQGVELKELRFQNSAVFDETAIENALDKYLESL